MGEFVGVKNMMTVRGDIFSLKREALMFNKIAIMGYKAVLEAAKKDSTDLYNDLEWLLEKGLVYETEDDVGPNVEIQSTDKEYKLYRDAYASHTDKVMEMMLEAMDKEGSLLQLVKTEAFKEALLVGAEYMSRIVSINLRELKRMDAIPIITHNLYTPVELESNKSHVISIILKTLPVPDEITPWEQIIEYRSDADSIDKFLDLRNWMNEVARGELTPIEIEQKLEYLMSQYNRHMELHRMKTNAGVLETIVVSGAELLEDLAKFKWGKIAKGLFSFKQKQVALLEGELTSPGSEVAYIIKARERFSTETKSNNSFNPTPR